MGNYELGIMKDEGFPHPSLLTVYCSLSFKAARDTA
jgi:hypothetical protein